MRNAGLKNHSRLILVALPLLVLAAPAAFGASASGTLAVTATVVASSGMEIGPATGSSRTMPIEVRLFDTRGGAIVMRTISRAEKIVAADAAPSLALKFRGTSLVVSPDVTNVTQEAGWRVMRDEICAPGKRCTRASAVTYEMWGF